MIWKWSSPTAMLLSPTISPLKNKRWLRAHLRRTAIGSWPCFGAGKKARSKRCVRASDSTPAAVIVSPFAASCDLNGWSQLLVRYIGERSAESQVFHGWWQHEDHIVRTVVAAPPPDSPIPLTIPAHSSTVLPVARSGWAACMLGLVWHTATTNSISTSSSSVPASAAVFPPFGWRRRDIKSPSWRWAGAGRRTICRAPVGPSIAGSGVPTSACAASSTCGSSGT